MDVLASAIVLLVFINVENRRLNINHRWLTVPALMLVGVSLALPLFLYLRELSLEHDDANSATSPRSKTQPHAAG